ncbi:PH domain-containing protein [Kitasatospora sp. NPDC094011]|uniref:PH domain-containing protein n=1 Tax=Kitasatospora sp. NPDC094011 TaxID=3364090 RepID=UPI0038081D4A
MQMRSELAAVGVLPLIGTGVLLVATGATDGFTAFVAGCAVGAAALFAAPYTFWLRVDEEGVTLVRCLVRRRFGWAEIDGLAVTFGREEETDGHFVVLRLRLADPPGRVAGPMVGKFGVTDEDTPSGVPPRAMAELFAVFGERGLPVEEAEFANEVLRVRGLPLLPPLRVWAEPAEGVPEPERAYADAPGIEEESAALPGHRKRPPQRYRREHLLRRAALADRVFLRDGDGLALGIALSAAEELVRYDLITVEGDQRRYVRQQYLSWRTLNR